MRRIAKNSCGFSGYTCIGIPRLMYLGMYKDLVALDIQRTNPSLSSVISVRSWLSSCDLGTPDPVQGFSECPESPTSTAYIWYNFGLLPTEICIYDKTAKASDLSLSLGLTELCLWTYDRYSHLYVSVALQIGGSVLVSDCYVKEQQNNIYKRVQHYPGILDPAHPIPDINVPDIYVPTLAPLVHVTIPEPPAADVAPAAFQAANAGNIAAAIAGSNLDKCPNDFATAASIASHSRDKTTYTISVAEGRFTVFGLDGTEIGRGTAEDLTTPVDVVADATVTRYAVCVITATESKSLASATAMYEFAALLVLRTNMTDTPEANTVLIPVAIITMGCVLATLYTSKFSTPAVNPDDDFSIKIDTSWLLLAFAKYLKDMDALPGGKCAANIKQLLCGPIKLGILQFHTNTATAGNMLNTSSSGAAVVVNTGAGPTLMPASIVGVADAQGTTVSRFAIARTEPSKATLLFVGATDNAGVYIPYICDGKFALDRIITTGASPSKTPALVCYNTSGAVSVTFTEKQTALIYYSGANNQITTVSIADTDNGILTSNKGTLKWVALPTGGGLLQTTSEGGLSIFEAEKETGTVYVLAGNGSSISSLALPTVSKSDGDTGSGGDTDEGTSIQALGWDGLSFDWVTVDIPVITPQELGLYFAKGGTTAGAPEWQLTGLGTEATPANQALRWTGTAFLAINILIAPEKKTADGCAARWNGTSFLDTAPLLQAPSSDTGDKLVLADINGKLTNVEAPKGLCTCVTPGKTPDNYALTFDGTNYSSIAVPTTPVNTGLNQALTYNDGTYDVIDVAPRPETSTEDTDKDTQALGWDGSKFTVVTIPNATTGLTIPPLQADQALSAADGALVGIDVVTPTNISTYAVTPDNIATYLAPYTDSTTVSNIVSDYVASSGGAPTVTTDVNLALTYDGSSWGTVSLLDTPVSSNAVTDVLDWDGTTWIRRLLLQVLNAPDDTDVYVLCARNQVPEWIKLRLSTVPSIVL